MYIEREKYKYFFTEDKYNLLLNKCNKTKIMICDNTIYLNNDEKASCCLKYSSLIQVVCPASMTQGFCFLSEIH